MTYDSNHPRSSASTWPRRLIQSEYELQHDQLGNRKISLEYSSTLSNMASGKLASRGAAYTQAAATVSRKVSIVRVSVAFAAMTLRATAPISAAASVVSSEVLTSVSIE